MLWLPLYNFLCMATREEKQAQFIHPGFGHIEAFKGSVLNTIWKYIKQNSPRLTFAMGFDS